MIKKIIAGISLVVISLFAVAFTAKKEEDFTYSYQIYANSNSAGDLLDLYKCKEYLVKTYDNLILSLEESLHKEAVITNINRFTNIENSVAEYKNGVILIKIGNAKGSNIYGNLKSNSCDNGVVDKKIFVLDWLFSW